MYQDSISGSGEAQYNFSGWKLVACNCWNNSKPKEDLGQCLDHVCSVFIPGQVTPLLNRLIEISGNVWLGSPDLAQDHQIWHQITRSGTKSPDLAPDHQMLQTFCIFTQSITTISHQTPIMAFHNLCNWKQCLHTWPHIVGMLWKVATSRSFCFFQYRQVSWVQP